MSTFNTRKDRKPDGTPKPHDSNKYNRYPCTRLIHNKSPAWWNRIHTTKVRRGHDSENIHRVMTGTDPDSLLWLPDSMPQFYYW